MLTSNRRQSAKKLRKQLHYRTRKHLRKLLRNVSKQHLPPVCRLLEIKIRQFKMLNSNRILSVRKLIMQLYHRTRKHHKRLLQNANKKRFSRARTLMQIKVKLSKAPSISQRQNARKLPKRLHHRTRKHHRRPLQNVSKKALPRV